MNNRERGFLVLAEELNFTKAAEKLFISQQGLSDHIRKLEAEYDTQLFIRTPRVVLTPAGKLLQRMLLQQSAMEKDIRNEIASLDSGATGHVKIGISPSALRSYGTDILEAHHRAHPGVYLEVVTATSLRLMEMIQDGKIDCGIVADPAPHADLSIEHLFIDPIYLAAPADVADQRTLPDEAADLSDYSDLAFVRGSQHGMSRALIDAYLARNEIGLNNIISATASDVQVELCTELHAAMFCPKSYAKFRHATMQKAGLRIMKIKDLDQQIDVTLVTSTKRYYSQCALDLFDSVRDILQDLSL